MRQACGNWLHRVCCLALPCEEKLFSLLSLDSPTNPVCSVLNLRIAVIGAPRLARVSQFQAKSLKPAR